jgi:hypothetical protein
MTATDFLKTAHDLVGGDREQTHGDKVANFGTIALFWDAYLRAKLMNGTKGANDGSRVMPEITGLDAANMMELMKIARRLSGAHNPDDYIDGGGYAGCAGEIAERLYG